MRYVQSGRFGPFWKSLLAANWSWCNYTELYVCDRNFLSNSYIFGLIHVYSHSILSSNPRAKGAVVPWCWKERLRGKILDSWSLVPFFWIWHHHTHIFFSFVDIRDVIYLHLHIRGLTFSFSFLARCTSGRLRTFHPSQDLPRRDPGGRTLRICWRIWPRLIIRGIHLRMRNTARVICSFQYYTL